VGFVSDKGWWGEDLKGLRTRRRYWKNQGPPENPDKGEKGAKLGREEIIKGVGHPSEKLSWRVWERGVG